MEDADLVLISFIVGGGITIVTMFGLVSLFPKLGMLNALIGVLTGFTVGILYFIQSKRIATGYWRLPDELKELHEKIKEIETHEELEIKKKNKRRDK